MFLFNLIRAIIKLIIKLGIGFKFMKKIFILLVSMSLLVGCIESVAVIGGGAANGKVAQSSLQTAVSYGIKKKTGQSPFGHALTYVKEKKPQKNQKFCSSFVDKKELELCLMVKERIDAKSLKEKELFSKPSKKITSSLQSSINKKSKIKYLD